MATSKFIGFFVSFINSMVKAFSISVFIQPNRVGFALVQAGGNEKFIGSKAASPALCQPRFGNSTMNAKKIVIDLIALAFASLAFADVVIGSGTASQYYPMSNYYNYYRSATLYTAAEINATGTISNLKWYCNTANTTVSFPIKIYLKHTPLTVMTAGTWATYSADATQVFSGTLAINATGWFNFDITDFAYNGTSNLMVLVESGSAAYTSPYVNWRYTNTATYMFARVQADNTVPTSLAISNTRPNITFVGITTAAPPVATTLVSPTNAATGIMENATINWNAASGATGYKLYFGTDNPPTNIVNGADQGNVLTYDPIGNMLPIQTYYWKVVPFNAYGDATGAPIWSFTTRPDPIVSTFPTVWDFGNTLTPFPPTNWTKHSGVLASPTVLGANPTGSWVGKNWKNTATTPQNVGACINIYSNWNGWLISPPIAVPGNDYEVKFDLAYMAYGNNNAPGTTGTDDQFAVLIGDGTSWTSANIVRKWDNAGSPYVLNNIPPAGMTVSLPLGSAGTKYIAFYGISTVSNADNDLMVDNVEVRQAPATAIFSLTPTAWNFGNTIINTIDTKTFAISNSGTGILDIGSIGITGDYFTLTANDAPASLTAGQSANFTVQYAPTAVGTHIGTVTITDGRAVNTVDLDGTCYDPTISTFPYSESFDVAVPPLGWTNLATVGAYAWDYQTAGTYPTCTPNSGAGMARYNSYNASAGNKALLVSPPLIFTNNLYRVRFSMYRDPGYPTYVDAVNVYYNTTNNTTSATLLGTINRPNTLAPVEAAAGWYSYFFILPGIASNNTGFVLFEAVSGRGNNIFIDDVTIELAPIGAPDPVTLLTPTEWASVSKTGFNLTWAPVVTGGAPTSYNIYMVLDAPEDIYNDQLFENVTSPFNPVTNGGLTFNYDERWYWTVEAVNDGGSAVVEPPRGFQIEADPSISVFPYLQAFGGSSFPPTMWTLASTGTYNWTRSATVNGYGAAENMGALRANFFNQAAGSTYDIITAPIDLDGIAGILNFDHAYATYAGENDKLEIMLSSNGVDYTSLVIYEGGATGPLNTGGTTTSTFLPTAAQWATKSVNLPTGTTHVKFRAISAYGNDLYIDNIQVNQNYVPPIFGLNPDVTEWNFGHSTIGVPVTKTFTVTNTGGDSLGLNAPIVSGTGFAVVSVSPDPWVPLAYNESASVVVSYSPIAAGNHTGTLTFTGPDSGVTYATVSLLGACIVPNPVATMVPADAAIDIQRNPTFSWTAGADPAPTGYKLYLGTDNPPTSIVNGSDLGLVQSYNHNSLLAASTVYYWKVVPYNVNGDAASNVTQSFTTGPAVVYAASYPTSNADTSIAQFIAGTFANPANTPDPLFNNASLAATYSDFTALGPIPLRQGGSIPVTIVHGSTGLYYNAYVRVFIDFNQNGYFDLPDEAVLGTAVTAYGKYYGTISIPHTAIIGTTRMRVVLQESGTDATTMPTGTYGYGETEDYTVEILEPAVGAPDPVSLFTPEDAATVPKTGFDLTWTPAVTGGAPTSYNLYIGMGSPENVFSGVSYVGVSSPFNPVLDGGLTFNYGETWYWTVQAVNSYDDAFPPNPFSFTIIADPTISSLPRTENFDNTAMPNLPYGWARYINSSSIYAYVQTATTNPVSSPNNLYIYNSADAAADLRLFTPQITVPMNTIRLSFYARSNAASQSLLIGTTNSPIGTGTLNQLTSIALTTTNTAYTVTLADYAGTDQYIYFKHGLGSTGRSIFIDNIMFEDLRSADLAAIEMGGQIYGFVGTPVTNTVTIKNNGLAAQSNYTVYLKSVETRDTLATSVETTQIMPEATREISLQWTPTSIGTIQIYGEVALAGDELITNNTTASIGFTTYLPGTLIEGFEGETFPPTGWTVVNGGDPNTWTRYTTGPRTGLASARIEYHSTMAHDDWLITPRLIPTTGDASFSFWAKNNSTSYIDRFNVMLSTTTRDVSNFTNVLATNIGPGITYTQYSYDLSAYIGQKVYIAIQAISTDELRLQIDDVIGPIIYTPSDLDEPLTAINPTPAHLATSISLHPVFSWEANPDPDYPVPTGYRFSLWNGANAIVDNLDLGDQSSYTHSEALNFGTQYSWKVFPYTTLEAENCPTWSFTTTNALAPQNLSAVAMPNHIMLNWDAPVYREAEKPNTLGLSSSATRQTLLGYNLYRNSVQINPELITLTNYNDSNVSHNQAYSYYVQAVYVEGLSAPSAVAELIFRNQAEISVTPTLVDFGEVVVTASSQIAITITNTGVIDLVVTDVQVASEAIGFDLSEFTVLPGQSQVLNLYYTPLYLEALSDTLRIFSNAWQNAQFELPLMGSSALPPEISISIESIDIASIGNADQTSTFSITNSGGSTLNSSLSSSANWLTVAPTEVSIVSGASQDITVTFHASGLPPAMYNTNISINSNDLNASTTLIPVSWNKELYHFTTIDNENNLGTGSPDNDLDIALAGNSSLMPIEFNIFAEANAVYQANLIVRAHNVDNSSGYLHSVRFNNHLLGNLHGFTDWSSTIFSLEPAWVLPGANLVQIVLDPLMSEPSVTVDLANLQINGAVQTAFIRTSVVPQPVYPGASVNVNLELDSSLGSQAVVVETYLYDQNSVLLGRTTRSRTLSGTSNDPFTETLTIPLSSSPGAYQVQVIVYDASYFLLQDMDILPLQVNPYVAQISISPQSLDFGAVLTGTTLVQNLQIQNLGLAELQISHLSIPTGAFSIQLSSLNIAAGASYSLPISFSPAVAGLQTDVLSILCNDPQNALLQVNLRGTGILNVPYIEVSADSLDFEDVFTVVPRTIPISISNQGPATLLVWQALSTDAAFSVSPQEISLAQYQSREIYVTFSPASIGAYGGTITLNNNSANNSAYAIAVSGNGIAAPVISVDPQTLAFSGFTGSVHPLAAEISNLGGGDLAWQVEDNFGKMLKTRGYTSSTTDYAVIPNQSQNQLYGGNFTVSLWTRVESNQGYGGNGGKQYIVSKSAETTNGFFGIYTDGVASGSSYKNLGLQVRVNGQNYTLGKNNVMALNQWYYIAVSYADNQMKLYLDGVLIDSKTVPSFNGNSTAWALGKMNSTTTNTYRYCGSIDEFRIFASALSSTDLLKYRYTRLSGTETGLAGYWNLDSGTMADGSPYLVNGTLYGGASIVNSTVSETPAWLGFTQTYGTTTDSETLNMNIDASDLVGGEYNATVRIRSNDPINSLVQVPLSVQLTGYALISLSTQSLDFGNVFGNEQGSRQFTIYNNGSDVLEISAFISTNPVFTTNAMPMQIAAGSSVVVTVYFNPLAAELYSGSLNISTDLAGFETVSLSLSGNGSLHPQISLSDNSFSSLLNHGDSETQILTIANLQGVDLEYSISIQEELGRGILDGSFDQFPAGIRGMAWVGNLLYLVNNSGNSLMVYNPATATVQQQFTIHNSPWGICYDGSKLWIGSAAGNFYEYSLQGELFRSFNFTQVTNPAMAWDGSQFLLARSFDPNPQIFKVNLQGISQGTLSLGSSGIRLSQIHWVPWHDPGHLWAVDSYAHKVRQFRLLGTQFVQVQAIDYAFTESASITHNGKDIYIAENQSGYLYRIDDGINEFNWVSADPLIGQVVAGASQAVSLTFQARTRFAGAYNANMLLSSNDPISPVISIPLSLNISGSPDLTCSSTDVDFGGLFVGYESTQTVQIANIGTSVLFVNISQYPTSAYTISPSTFSIAPLSSQNLSITFHPTGVASYPEILLLQSNDPDDANVEINLSGSGVNPPQAALNTAVINASLNNWDTPSQHIINLSNNGGFPLNYNVILEETSGREGDRFLGDVIGTYPSFPDSTMGMLFSGSDLYVVDNAQAKLKIYNTVSNSITASYSIHSRPSGIAWDGEAFWIGDQGGYLYKYPLSSLNSTNSVPVTSFKSPTNGIPSFCWMGDAFLMNNAWIDSGNTTFYRVNRSGVTLETYSSNVGTFISQIAWVPQYAEQKLWAYQNVRDGDYFTSGKILKLSLQSGSISKTSEKVFHDNQIAFSFTNDGKDLWYSDGNGPLYRLDDGRWMSSNIVSGVVEPDRQGQNITLELNPQRRNGGTYTGNFKISSNDPLNPMLSIPVTMNVTGSPDIAVNPSSYTFPSTFTGESRQAQFTIQNTGTDVLNVSSISSNQPIFSVSPQTLNLGIGASATLNLTFAPTVAGSFADTLSITSNSTQNPVLQLPISGTAAVRSPSLQVSDNLLNFGAVTVGSNSYRDLVISNSGTAALSISSFTFNPAVFSSLSSAQSIAAGQQSTVRIFFTPVGGTVYQGSLVINSNDPNTPEKLIVLSGLGEVGQSNIAVNPVTYDFGAVSVGSSSSYTISVANQGNGSLEISQIISDLAVFSTLSAPQNVAVGSALDLPITFSPIANANYNGTITLYSNDPDTPVLTISLSGSGVAVPIIAADPTSLDRYIVSENIETANVTISNSGTASLNYSISFSGSPAWLSANPVSGTVAAGSSAIVELSLNTTVITAGAYQSNMLISSNDSQNPLLQIPITLVHSDFNFTTQDNENNALAGIADNDLDVNLNEYDARHPVEFNIFTNQVAATERILRVRAYNIRSDEISQVRINNNLLGNLRANPSGWSISQFRIPNAQLNFGANASNLVQISLDTTHKNAGTSSIDWGHLLFDGDGVYANSRHFYVSSTNHYAGSSVLLSLENDTQLYSQNLRSEIRMYNPSHELLGTNILTNSISYGNDEAQTSTFTLPIDAAPGTYSMELSVYDTANNVLQTSRSVTFSVGAYLPQISVVSSLDFGTVFTGQQGSLNLQVKNLGTAPLNVSEILSDNPVFQISSSAFTLVTNQIQSIPITFNPTVAGNITGNIRILSNDPASPTAIALSGVAIDPPTIGLDITGIQKQLYLSQSGSDQFLIRNTGSSTLQVSSIGRTIITGSSWLSVSPASATILPGASAVVYLNFSTGSNGTGIYEAAINIRSNDPANGYIVLPVTLQVNARPVANFTASPVSGLSPLTVQFTDTSIPLPGDPITGWSWDFKNNGSALSTQQNPEYTYTTPGTYSVKLTITTASGLSGTVTRTSYIAVQNNPPVVVNPTQQIRITMVENTTNNSLNLNNVFSDPDGDPLTFSYTNNQYVGMSISNGIVTLTPVQYWSGEATLSFTARDNRQGVVSVSVILTVIPVNDPPQFALPAGLAFLKNTALTVDFAPYISDPDGSDAGLNLVVSNGTQVSAAVNGTMVTFTAASDWFGTESLNLSLSDGIASPVYATLAVDVLDVFTADFHADVLDPVCGSIVQFHDDTIGNPNYWEWEFNYEERVINSYEQHPSYVFGFGGLKSVKLTVAYRENQINHGTDSLLREDYIQVRGTLISGNVSGTWDLMSSPYTVNANIAILAGTTLNVQNGVEVFFLADVPFEINGTINATGADFSALSNSDGETGTRTIPRWKGLAFGNSSQNCVLTNVSISDAETPVSILGTNPSLSNVSITKNDSLFFANESAFSLENSSANLSNVEISNYSTGIKVLNSGDTRIAITPTLSNIRIRNNSSGARPDAIGIKLDGYVAANLNTIQLDDFPLGIQYTGTGQLATTTPTLSNIRIRNASSSSRTSGTAIYIKDIPQFSILNNPAVADSIVGYDKAIVVENSFLATSSPTISNIRIRNTNSNARPEDIGIEMIGRISGSLNNLDLEDYSTGIKISNLQNQLSSPALNNLRIRRAVDNMDTRTDDTAILIEGKVAVQANNLKLDEYSTGIVLNGDATILAGQTPTLTNVRIRNTGSASRVGTIGIKIKDVPFVNITNTPASTDSIVGYLQGVVVETELGTYSTPTISNVRIRNTNSSSRTNNTAIVLNGKISPVFSNLDLDDYYNGIEHIGDGSQNLNQTPTLTNIRIRNTETGSRLSGKGIYLKDIKYYTIQGDSIVGYSTAIDVVNEMTTYSTPSISNIRVRNTSSNSRNDTGMKFTGKVSPILTNIQVDDYGYGLVIQGDGSDNPSQMPAITNSRVYNSGLGFFDGIKGIQLIDLDRASVSGSQIYGFGIGVDLMNTLQNTSTPTLTNIRVKSTSTSSRTGDIGISYSGKIAGSFSSSIIEDFTFGTKISGENSSQIQRNEYLNCSNGIRIEGSNASTDFSYNLLHRDSSMPLSLLSAINLQDCQDLVIHNNTIYGYQNGLSSVNSSGTFTQNIVWSDAALANPLSMDTASAMTVSYNNVYGSSGPVAGINNINANPLFVNALTADYHLDMHSPCIDAGNPAMATDSDGSVADLGAFVYLHGAAFTANPPLGARVGDVINFTPSTTGHSDTAIYQWYFRNATDIDSYEESPAYTYTEPGAYNIKLIVSTANFSDAVILSGYNVLAEEALPIPQNVQASAWESQISLSWNILSRQEEGSVFRSAMDKGHSLQKASFTGFRIFRKSSAEGSFTQVSQVPATTFSYNDTGLTPQIYTYYVVTYDAENESLPSSSASAEVKRVSNPWFDPASTGFAENITVSIYCDTPLAAIYFTTDGSMPTTSSQLYTQALVIAQNTNIRAVAYSDGWIHSDIVSASYEYLNPPTNLQAHQANGSIALSWISPQQKAVNSAAGAAAKAYSSRWQELSSFKVYRDGLHIADATGTVFTDMEVEIGIQYSYYVTAMYGTLESTSSNLISITPIENTNTANMAYDNPSYTYSASIDPSGTGSLVHMQFTPENQIQTAVNVVYSTNPLLVSGLGNPAALGAYFSFNGQDNALFTGLVHFRLQLPNTPNDMWYRIGGGNWSLIAGATLLSPPLDNYTYEFTLNLGAKHKSPSVEFAFDKGGDDTLPIHLSYFGVNLSQDHTALLKWRVESEINHSGYNVLRSQSSALSDAIKINSEMIIHGDINGTAIQYSFTDWEVEAPHTYYYWLESVCIDGISTFAGPLVLNVPDPETPEIPVPGISTALLDAFPNPFNPNTNIRYSLKEAGAVKISIYNLKGQLIRSFTANHGSKGFYQLAWDGKDENGALIGSGVYVYRMESGKYTSTKKMVMTK